MEESRWKGEGAEAPIPREWGGQTTQEGEEVEDEGVESGRQACRMCRAWRTTALEPQRRRLLDVTREVVTVGAAAGLTMAAAKIGH